LVPVPPSAMNEPTDSTEAALAAIEALRNQLLTGVVKPLDLNSSFDAAEVVKSLTAALAQDTERWRELQDRYYRKQLELWAAYAQPEAGSPPQPVVQPDAADRRFRAPEWRNQPYFDYLAQSYLLTGQWLR